MYRNEILFTIHVFYNTKKHTKSTVKISNNVNVVTLADLLCKGLASGSSVGLCSFFFPYSVISCQVPTEIMKKKKKKKFV